MDKFGLPDAKALKNIWHRIHRNIFTHREPKSVTEDDVLICACVPDPETGKGCGPDCINRDVLVECDPAFCPCGDGCQNQKFQKKDYAKLDIRRTGRKGHGLFTKQALKKGQFIIEYIGEVLHEDEYRSRKARYDEEGRRHYYFMTLSSSETIDAAERGNAGRFLNHSCDPNCETQKWMVNGELCIGIYALTDIDAGDELTFDYNFERYGDNPIKCFCGTSRCGGWIGAPKDDEGGKDDDSDDDIDAFDPDLDPDPVMLEADEAAIEKEEEEGRTAKMRERIRARRGSGDDIARWKPKDVYGNDDDDYDGDGEIARVRREKEREEARARKSSGGGGGGGGGRRSGGGSGVRRSGSSAGLKRVGSSQSGGLLPSNYGSYALGARRSEVDVKMERLRGKSGALRNSRCGKECIHLFNLAYFVTKEGVADVSQRDLGLLLEAVALTTNPKTQADLVEYGLLQAFQVCVHKLGGAGAGPDYVPILRKIIKIIDNIMTNSPRLVKDGVVKARTARGTLAQALADLRRSPDSGLRGLAAGFCAKLDQDAIASAGGYGVTPGRVSPAFGAAGGGANAPPPPYAARGAGGGYYGASPAGSAAAGSGAPPSGDRPRGAPRADPPWRPPRPRPPPTATSAPGIGTAPRGAAWCSRPSRRASDAASASPRMPTTPRRRCAGPAVGVWVRMDSRRDRSPAAGPSVPEAGPSGPSTRPRGRGTPTGPPGSPVTIAARSGTSPATAPLGGAAGAAVSGTSSGTARVRSRTRAPPLKPRTPASAHPPRPPCPPSPRAVSAIDGTTPRGASAPGWKILAAAGAASCETAILRPPRGPRRRGWAGRRAGSRRRRGWASAGSRRRRGWRRRDRRPRGRGRRRRRSSSRFRSARRRLRRSGTRRCRRRSWTTCPR